jgi:hypothetical protein
MRSRRRILGSLLAAVILLGMSSAAPAAATGAQQCNTAGFLGLTGQCPDLSVGRSQFFLDILNGSPPGQVLFQFRNIGPAPSSITAIFFEDRGAGGDAGTPVLAGLVVSAAGVGTLFVRPANTVHLPGENILAPTFQSSKPFTLVADSPTDGINPGESLGVAASLQPNKAALDVLNAVQSGQVRIGLMADGFASGAAASFINTNIRIPAPGAVLLVAIGTVLFGCLCRHRRL